SLLCIIPTALLFFGEPVGSPGNITFVLALVVMANIGFELAQVFYNAMLPHVAPPAMVGRISGWGWGLGDLGGLSALGVAMIGLIGIEGHEPLFGISGMDSMNVRASGPLVAIWFALFMIPLFIFTRDIERRP